MRHEAGHRRQPPLVGLVLAVAAGVTACGGPATAPATAPAAGDGSPAARPSSGAAGAPGDPGVTTPPTAGHADDGPSAGAPPAGRTAVDTAVDTAVPAPAGPGPARERVTAPGDQPVDVRIPQIGVDSPLVRLGASAQGEMQVPTDFDRAGWFTGGAAPGERGPAVLAGHVDSRTGPAVFYRLAELRAGDRIEVEQRDGDVVRFTVSRVERYAKAAFPTARVYGPVPGPVLRLITCGGVFDRATGHYRDNVVVYANPV